MTCTNQALPPRATAKPINWPVTHDARLRTIFLLASHHPAMFKAPFAYGLFIIAVYFILHIMASDEQPKKHEEVLVDMGGKKVALSSINKPHNVVVGGANKAVPNLDNFPSLEPWAQEQAEKDAKKAEKKTEKSE